jgi:Luciferase-like monooxygenase/Glucose-6-phosphate dehydrogenase, NAD binding domain
MSVVKIGVSLPICGDRNVHGAPSLIAVAQRAEELGLDTASVSDVLLGDGTPAVESIVAAAAVATATSRVTVEFGVLVLPIRQVAWVAAQIAGLQHLSNNRIVLGVGAGSFPKSPFWRAVDGPEHDRGAVTEAMLKVLPTNSCSADGSGAQLRCKSETWGAAMSEQLYDFFGEILQRYFRPAIDAYPPMGGTLVERLLTLSDDVPGRLAQTRRAAMAWGKAETPNARITSEVFVITQHGLMYAVGFNESRRALYYLATPSALFDPFVDQFDTAELPEGAVGVVDSRLGRDLASAHPMDAALRRILDEHLALRVDLPA